MTDNGFRHDLTPEQKRMTDKQLVATLPDGTGLSLLHYSPYWNVVMRSVGGKIEYIVTDSSTGPDRKPVRVYGPVTNRKDAEAWAKSTASAWHMVAVQRPEWPWE